MDFKQDIIDLFSGRRGGHTQKWLYADHPRAVGKSGSQRWHSFVTANDNYYPIRAEIDMIPDLIRALDNDHDAIVDFGIGDCKALRQKTLPVLKAQKSLQHYYAIDISADHLTTGLKEIKTHLPMLETTGLQGDFYQGQGGITGNRRLGLFLGATISNIDMRIGDNFPRADIIGKIARLGQTIAGGDKSSLVISFDQNPDLNHAMAAYQHLSWKRMMTGLMYDVQKLLKPEGNFNPALWRYRGIIDKKNHVLHQTISPAETQHFILGGHEFDIRRGDVLVVKNNFKYPLDMFVGMVEAAGLSHKRTIRSDDHPMVMIEARV